jgi:tetratricopeptide (TPR) repeat protein
MDMNAETESRFDAEALRSRMGAKTFARGEAYYNSGRVVILSNEPGRVLAQVSGTQIYQTDITGQGAAISGACSCPAFEDSGFCKHMVAVALTANAADADAEEAGAIPRIRDHLKGHDVDFLVDMILRLAERDSALFLRLDMAALTDSGDDKAIELRLRRAIDRATKTDNSLDYRESRWWAAGVSDVLDAIAELLPTGRATLLLTLSERVLDRVEQAVETITDSDHFCRRLLERACQLHLAAASAKRPEPIPFARALFRREAESRHGTFNGAARRYAEVLGEEGLAEYRRLANEAWQKLPPLRGRRDGECEFSSDHHRLEAILDFFAERDGDVDVRIALRAKDLSSPSAYLQLAVFCLDQGRREEALRRAEEGLWVFEDGPRDDRLLLFAAELLSKVGRSADAETLLWRGFEKAPSFGLYESLCCVGGDSGRKRAIASLQSHLADAQSSRRHLTADLLVHILMRDERPSEAWALVRQHGASIGARERLARMTDTAFPWEAREVYAERVEQLIVCGGNTGYFKAMELIGRMAELTDADKHAAYVDAIKMRHGRKRNLMKFLG